MHDPWHGVLALACATFLAFAATFWGLVFAFVGVLGVLLAGWLWWRLGEAVVRVLALVLEFIPVVVLVLVVAIVLILEVAVYI